MNHSEIARKAFAFLGIDLKAVSHELAVASAGRAQQERFEESLRCEGDHFDLKAPSLQNRLLDCFESKFGFENARARLEEADNRRMEILRQIVMDVKVLSDKKRNQFDRFIVGFSDFELFRLSCVIFSADPSAALKAPPIKRLLTKKIEEGCGEGLIRYLAAGFQYAEKRRSRERGVLEEFNPALLIAALKWTDPGCPLWLMPGPVAARIISDLSDEHFSKEAFNDMTRRRGLKRVPERILSKFFSSAQRDPECLALKGEFESVVGVSFDIARPGRPRGC